MSFEANDRKIYDLFNKQHFMVPRNQRRYVWNENNWNELFDDISLVVCEDFPAHFIGSIVLNSEGRKNGLSNYKIIDGQQRIITLTIFLASIGFCMKKNSMNEDFQGTMQYLITKDDKAKDIVMVSSYYHEALENLVKKIFDSEISKQTNLNSFIDIMIVSSHDKIIGSAFKYFITRIQENEYYLHNPIEYLLKIRDAVLDISYVSIISSTEEDSYTIFEILNARGMGLEDHELLKNYIMRYIYPDHDRDEAKLVWAEMEKSLGNDIGRFIKHYTLHKFGHDKDLNDYKLIQKSTKKVSVRALLDDLRVKSKYYVKFIAPKIGEGMDECSDIEYDVFTFFKKKRYRQMRPVLLSLIHNTYNGDVEKSYYEKIILYLKDFYICYNIIGDENSNKLTNCINKFSLKMENNFEQKDLEDFIMELISKMPNYETFLNSFKTIGWSHHSNFFEGEKNKNRVQTVLEVLERYKNEGYCKQDFTIEHILDDSKSTDNSIIGNLIPLESSLNRRCVHKDFTEKCKIYEDSNYKIARNFGRRYKEATEFNPKERTEIMAKEFYYQILSIERIEKDLGNFKD